MNDDNDNPTFDEHDLNSVDKINRITQNSELPNPKVHIIIII